MIVWVRERERGGRRGIGAVNKPITIMLVEENTCSGRCNGSGSWVGG